MKADDLAPAPSRPSQVVIGLADVDASTPARAYFEAFRWEPPAIDPQVLAASAFLAFLESA